MNPVEWALKTIIFRGKNVTPKPYCSHDPEVVKDWELNMWHAMMVLYRRGVHKDVVEHLHSHESFYVSRHAKELTATWPETR